ncbi:MAG TPA: VWA domain-containing protein [Acidobacteriaceae bacterium]|jgi:VWFA-related protein|nr:VWA domain-containing protein [Acidobacteriaceae bacterium]
MAQQAASPDAPAPQQQAIPDAPSARGGGQNGTLPRLNTITPPAPAVPASAAPRPAEATPDGATRDNGGLVPGSNLPANPAPAGQSTEGEPAPEIPAPGQGASSAYRIGTVNVDFVQIPFTVKDSKGQLVPGLTWRDVRVYENGLRQQMRFFTVDPFPLSVALVIDQSVTFDTMEKINSSLGALQGAFTPYDEMAVFTYNNGVRKQTTFTAAQSNRLGVILERSKGGGREPLMPLGGPLSQTTIKNNQQVDPNTAPIRNSTNIYETAPREFHTLLDAVFTAAQELSQAAPNRRRVLYVVSDGKEYGSKVKEKELIRYLQTNKISVYATLVGDSSMPGMGFLDRIHLPLTMRDDVLPRLTSVTGGQTDPEFRPRGIETSFARISETVRTQYTVGYYTHEPPIDGKFRHVEVRVMRPNLTVIAQDGYYPSPRNVHRGVPVSAPAQNTPPNTPPSGNQTGSPAANTPPPTP